MPLVDRATIEEAARRLHEAAPGSSVNLFGSYARGDARDDSDVDFLVVQPEAAKYRSESVRLRQVLRPLRIPVDVLLASRAEYEQQSNWFGSVFRDAAEEGEVLAAAS